MAAGAGSIPNSEEEWRAVLSPEQFRILRQKGTELEHTTRTTTKETHPGKLNTLPLVTKEIQREQLNDAHVEPYSGNQTPIRFD
ncbi:hypothetical protein GIB67_041400 [Kingdonia uniflora]|uniref:MsrB domain-containing protein n=1 Tax=Kingdonia uniflora TaxID=39325 RepID=A0A7J7LRD2_9MAGN|nr:hypothetical protein GIB67_041400 [Kingdonia uniflora]